MNRKSITGVEIKDADKGEVTAVIATFDVVDLDQDVTKAGAFHDGEELIISAYGHASWYSALPVGKGVIRSTKSEAIVDAQFFMDTQAGADTFRVVKALGPLQEWSYGYDPLKFSYGEHEGQRVRFLEDVKAYEASPVLVGAGVGTRTLTAKSGSLRLVDEAAAVMAAVQDLVDRAADVMAKRQDKGKGLGGETAEQLTGVQAQLKRLQDLLTPPPEAVPEQDVTREFLRMLARQ